MRVNGTRQIVEHINGVEYQTLLLPAGKNFIWSAWLTKTFLPSVGSAVDGLQLGQEGFGVMFTEMALHLASRMEEEKMFQLVKDLTGDLYVDGKKVNFDDYFAGEKMGELLLVLQWLMKENFSGFFTNPALKMWWTNLLATFSQNQEQPQESNNSPA